MAPTRGLSRLYVIVDAQSCRMGGQGMIAVARAAMEAGARLLQLRDREGLAPWSRDDLAALTDLMAQARELGAEILINRRLDVVRAVRAPGVHGPEPPETALGLLWSFPAHSLFEAQEADARGAHLVTLSPVFATASKPGYGPTLGLAGLEAACRALGLPVYALGGIGPGEVQGCVGAGAYGVAVMGGICQSPEPGRATAKYLAAMDAALEAALSE